MQTTPMENIQFNLDASRTPNECPVCHQPTLIKYVLVELNNEAPTPYGECSRMECGYKRDPNADQLFVNGLRAALSLVDIKASMDRRNEPTAVDRGDSEEIPFDAIGYDDKSDYGSNGYFKRLVSTYGVPAETLAKLFKRYYIGTVHQGPYQGCATLPRLDIYGKFRAVQTVTENGIIETSQDYFPDSSEGILFGEHLLSLDAKRLQCVNMVLNPVDAVVGSLYMPEFPWVAIGSIDYLSEKTLPVLQSQLISVWVAAHPDSGNHEFEKWEQKIKDLNFFDIKVHRINATSIRDHFKQFDYKSFRANQG